MVLVSMLPKASTRATVRGADVELSLAPGVVLVIEPVPMASSKPPRVR